MELLTSDSMELTFQQNFEEKWQAYESEHQGSFRKPWTNDRIVEVITNLKNGRVAMVNRDCRTAMSYYWQSKYDLITTNNEEYLIFRRKSPEDPVIRIIPREEYFDILNMVHKNCGHGGRDKTMYNIKNRYYIPKKAIEIFISFCPTCNTKRNVPRKGGPAACKTKWIHIRDQFRRTLKKRKITTDMGAGTTRKYKYEDMLQFIVPQISERETSSNISLSQEQHVEDEELEETQESDNTQRNENYPVDKGMSSSEGKAISSSHNNSFVKPVETNSRKISRTNPFENSPSSQLMAYILEEKKGQKQKEVRSSPEQLDSVDAFLTGISHTLKTLSPLLLNEGKTKIFSIVQELERKQILESQSRVVAPLQVQTLQIPEASPVTSTYSSPSPTYSSTLLPSPRYNLTSPSPEALSNSSQSMLQPIEQNIPQ